MVIERICPVGVSSPGPPAPIVLRWGIYIIEWRVTEDSPLSETLSGEQANFIMAMREIEQMLAQGFSGEITLFCRNGGLMDYGFSVRGHERRQMQRRMSGPRGEDRRKDDDSGGGAKSA